MLCLKLCLCSVCFFRDADLIFATLMEYERACMRTANPTDISKAQAAFFTSVISSFTSEGTHTLRRYIQTTGDTKKLTTFLLKGQRTAEAGAAYAMRALKENDFREKQGLLSEASRIFGLGKETAFHKSSTDDYVELLKDRKWDYSFISLSFFGTVAVSLRVLLTCLQFALSQRKRCGKSTVPRTSLQFPLQSRPPFQQS